MSSNWQSGTGKDRNWFSGVPTPSSPFGKSSAQPDTRLAGIQPIGQSTAALAASQIQIAALFQNIRQILDRSRDEIANQLQTSPRVIEYLETGRFYALPAWPETSRVVTAYTRLAGIDPAPALHVLQRFVPVRSSQANETAATAHTRSARQAENQATRSAPTAPRQTAHQAHSKTEPANEPPKWRRGRSGTPVPVGASHTPAATDAQTDAPAALSDAVAGRFAQMWNAFKGGLKNHQIGALTDGEGTRPSKRMVVLGGGAVLGLFAMLAVLSSPAAARFANANLPSPLANAFASVHAILRPPKIYERDGMRWIEVSDPRTRRTDKLPARSK